MCKIYSIKFASFLFKYQAMGAGSFFDIFADSYVLFWDSSTGGYHSDSVCRVPEIDRVQGGGVGVMTVLMGITSSLHADCKKMIGIMADSHGRSESIAAALGVFTGMDCRAIYYLGDVCDSTHPEIAEACLGSLRDPRVIIKKARMTRSLLPNISAGKDRRFPQRFYGILETCLS